MNDIYFLCGEHRVFADAGYRWAYWTLEDTGIVSLGNPIDRDPVLACTDYWSPLSDGSDDELSRVILPTVKCFLETHSCCKILYVDEEYLFEHCLQGYSELQLDENGQRILTVPSWLQDDIS